MEKAGESRERVIDVMSRREFLASTAVTAATLTALPGQVLGASAKSLRSEVRLHKGKPALFVNGRLTSVITAFLGRSEDLPDLLQSGFKIIDIGVPFGWTGPESYDYTGTDTRMDECLRQSDKILILPRMNVVPGEWWGEQFPNDISRRADGSPAQFKQKWHPSFASPKYRQLALPAIRSFVRHLEDKYGPRVLGYFVCNGVYGEWLSWNAYWEVNPGEPPPNKFGVEDYSAPAQDAFRQWLQRKYADNLARLRDAWGDPNVDYQTATVPSEETRKRPPHGIFFDPNASTQVPDYFAFYNDLISDVLLEQVRATKESVRRRKIAGVFYGYLWTNYQHLSMNHSGHLGLQKILAYRDIDFIAGPYTYDNRSVGGANTAQGLPETAGRYAKLYFNEADTETHLRQRQWRWGDSLRNPVNFAETKGLLVRDFAYAFTGGFGTWFMELLAGMYHDSAIISLLARLLDIDRKYLAADKRAETEIAVVLDEPSFTYFADGEPFLTALLNAQKSYELVYLGAPFETIRLADLVAGRTPPFKLYLFLNTFRVTSHQRERVQARLNREGATALWVYAPGYIDQDLSVENMRRLTGIRLAESDQGGELHVEITDFAHPYTRSLPAGTAYGTDVNVEAIRRYLDHQIYLKDLSKPNLPPLPGLKIAPRFYGDDPGATVLGSLAGYDRPGLLAKRLSRWTSVYSSAPILPVSLLRNIARAAGCHIYSDANDVVYASRRFLAIYSPAGGERTIQLRRPARAVDLLEDRVLTTNARSLSLQLEPNGAALLAL
ncbi:MAG TPA: beta-galactosidase [Verrucomicrobiae bacterium]